MKRVGWRWSRAAIRRFPSLIFQGRSGKRNDFSPPGEGEQKCCFSQVLHEMIVFSRAHRDVQDVEVVQWMEGAAWQLSVFAAEVRVNLPLSAILQINACSDWSPRGSSKWQRMKKWRKTSMIHRSCFQNEDVSFPTQLLNLWPLFSRICFSFCWRLIKHAHFRPSYHGLFTWLPHDGYPRSTWLYLPSNSCSLSLPIATIKLGFPSGSTTLSTNFFHRNVHIRKSFVTLASTRDLKDFLVFHGQFHSVVQPVHRQEPTTKTVGGRWSTRHRLRGVWSCCRWRWTGQCSGGGDKVNVFVSGHWVHAYAHALGPARQPQ